MATFAHKKSPCPPLPWCLYDLDLLQSIAVCCSMVQCVAGNEVLEPPSHTFNIDLLANLNLQEILTSELRQYRHVHTLTHTHTHTTFLHIYMYICTYICIYIHVDIYIHIYVYSFVYMFTHVCIDIYYVLIYIYISMCTYIHTFMCTYISTSKLTRYDSALQSDTRLNMYSEKKAFCFIISLRQIAIRDDTEWHGFAAWHLIRYIFRTEVFLLCILGKKSHSVVYPISAAWYSNW